MHWSPHTFKLFRRQGSSSSLWNELHNCRLQFLFPEKGNGLWTTALRCESCALLRFYTLLHSKMKRTISSTCPLAHLPTGWQRGAAGAWQREGGNAASNQQPSSPLSAAKSFLIMKNVRNICSKWLRSVRRKSFPVLWSFLQCIREVRLHELRT